MVDRLIDVEILVLDTDQLVRVQGCEAHTEAVVRQDHDEAARLLVVLHGAGGDGGLLALHEGTDGMDFCDIRNFHIFRDRLCALGGSGRGQADE